MSTPRKYLPADIDSMMGAIRDWVVANLGGYTVIWGDQDAPAPAHPYAVLLMFAAHNIGRRYIALAGTTEQIEFDSEFKIRCELLSRASLLPGGSSPVLTDIARLATSLWTGPRIEAFDVAGLAPVGNAPPVSVPIVAGFGMERRAYIDITFRARTRFETPDVAYLDQTSLPTAGVVNVDGNAVGTVGV